MNHHIWFDVPKSIVQKHRLFAYCLFCTSLSLMSDLRHVNIISGISDIAHSDLFLIDSQILLCKKQKTNEINRYRTFSLFKFYLLKFVRVPLKIILINHLKNVL